MTGLESFAYPSKSDVSRGPKGSVAPKRNEPCGLNTCRDTAALFLLAICLGGCARAPSLDILGSFFPAWLLCLAMGLLLSFAAHWLLSRFGIVIAVPILTYPCLTVLFACVLWLALFH
jgi:hypothetical protein